MHIDTEIIKKSLKPFTRERRR